VGVAAALLRDEAVVGVLDVVPRNCGPEGWSHFHALQNEVNAEAILTLYPLQVRADVILLAHAFLRPLHRNPLLTGEGIHPTAVITGALAQNLLRDHTDAMDIAEKMNDVFRARQQWQVSQNDDTVETVIYKSQQAAKQLGKGLHRSLLDVLVLTTRSSDKGPVEPNPPAISFQFLGLQKFQNIFG
jgi:hypothetical protein